MAYRNTPSPGDDILDLNELRRQLDDLEMLREDASDQDALEEAESEDGCGIWTGPDDQVYINDGSWDTDLHEEWRKLDDFLSEVGGRADTAILDSHFETYAQELADDIGAIDRHAKWPLNHIDWEAAADELRHDYSTAEWDGHTYLYQD
jgi:hypothetical protein